MGPRNQSRFHPTVSARLRLEALEGRDVPAAIGTLDPTFGVGGWGAVPAALFNIPGGHAVAVDPFGRTVFVANDQNCLVTRVNPDGSPDLSFGSGGTLNLGPANFEGTAVTFDAGGDMVLLHGADVTRLTPAGVPDTTFGTGGTAALGATGFGVIGGGGVAIDAAGNIVAAGDGMRVVRLTPSGRLDPAFNSGAAAWAGSPADRSRSYAVTIDPAGRIVVAGFASLYERKIYEASWSVGRLNQDGTLDTTFGGTGNVLPLVDEVDVPVGVATGVVTDRAGDILLAGDDGGHVKVLKLTSAGNLDPSFGAGGVVEAPIGSAPDAYTYVGLVLRTDGDVVGAATVAPGSDVPWRVGVFELTPAGTLDTTFDPDGPTPGTNVIATGPRTNFLSFGLGLTPVGDVVVGGLGRLTPRADYTSDVVFAKLVGTAPTNPFAALKVPVRVAVGDVNGDGVADTLYVTGPGTPLRLAVVSGADRTTLLVPPTDPFGDNFTGGAYVAAADFDHSGRAQIVVAADVGGGPRVAIWGLSAGGQLTERASFFGITGDPSFRGGTRVAVGDVNADGTPDLVVAAGYGGGPRVAVFDGATVLSGTPTKLVSDFFAFPGADAVTLRNGTFVAVGDVDGDGFGDLIFGGGPGGGPRVVVVSGKVLIQGGPAAAVAAPVSNFFVGGNDTTRTGVAVAVTTVAGDGVADVVAGPPPGTVPVTTTSPPSVPVYAGSTLTGGAPPAPAMTIDPTTDTVLAAVFVG